MTIEELLKKEMFRTVNPGEDKERQITGVFCCDLLSIAMGKAPADCAWVTVMGNVNAIAVAVLADTACLVLAENAALDDQARMRADSQGVPVLGSALPVFDAGLCIQRLLERE